MDEQYGAAYRVTETNAAQQQEKEKDLQEERERMEATREANEAVASGATPEEQEVDRKEPVMSHIDIVVLILCVLSIIAMMVLTYMRWGRDDPSGSSVLNTMTEDFVKNLKGLTKQRNTMKF